MIVSNNVFPTSNLPPGSQDWGRQAEGAAVANRDAANQLGDRADSDYRQFDATVRGVSLQTYDIQRTVYSIPAGYVYTTTISNFALPSATWTRMAGVRVPVPRLKNRVMVYVTASLNVRTDSSLPAVWVDLWPGSGSGVVSPTYGITGTAGYYRQGQFTNTALYLFGSAGGSIEPAVSLWASAAVAGDSQTTLTFTEYFLYGGQV